MCSVIVSSFSFLLHGPELKMLWYTQIHDPTLDSFHLILIWETMHYSPTLRTQLPEHIRRFYRIYFKQETLVNSMLRINRYNLQIRIAVHPCLPFCYFISSHLYEQHEWLQPARISWLNHFLLLQHFWQDCNAQPQRWTSSPPAPGTWSESSAASSPPARWFGLGAQRCPIPSRSNIVGKCRGNYVWFYRQRLRFDVTRGSSRHARMCPA